MAFGQGFTWIAPSMYFMLKNDVRPFHLRGLEESLRSQGKSLSDSLGPTYYPRHPQNHHGRAGGGGGGGGRGKRRRASEGGGDEKGISLIGTRYF